MNKPFEYIVNNTVYGLRYPYYGGYGYNRNNGDRSTIPECITKTAAQYDQTQVTPAQFAEMINKITSGGSSSPIRYRNNVDETVQAICIYYPILLTVSNVTSLVKCFNSANMNSVEYIEDTGYKFTNAQIQTLTKNGILMIDKLNDMTLSGFYALFGNASFIEKVKDWNMDPDLHTTDPEAAKGKIKIYPQYEYLAKIIKKFDLKLDEKIWSKCFETIASGRISTMALINLHTVLVALGAPISNETLDVFLVDSNHGLLCGSLEKSIQDIDRVFEFYDNPKIDRSYIKRCMSQHDFGTMKIILGSRFCSYDLLEDLYYWLERENSPGQYLISRVKATGDTDLMAHVIMLGYVDEAEACQFLSQHPEYLNDNEYAMKHISFNGSQKVIQMYIDNKFIADLDTVEYIRSNEYLKNLHTNLLSCTEPAQDKLSQLIYEDSVGAEVDRMKRPYHGYYSHYDRSNNDVYKVLESLSDRDGRIFSHLISTKEYALTNIQNILFYDVVITKKYLKYLLMMGYEDIVIKLMHISRKYDYLIDMIDEEMVLACHNYLPRMWFHKYIVTARKVGTILHSFCLYDGYGRDDELSSDEELIDASDSYRHERDFVFSVERNDAPNSDINIDMIDNRSEFKAKFEKKNRDIREAALLRIISRA